jgi:hypothetical protein
MVLIVMFMPDNTAPMMPIKPMLEGLVWERGQAEDEGQKKVKGEAVGRWDIFAKNVGTTRSRRIGVVS